MKILWILFLFIVGATTFSETSYAKVFDVNTDFYQVTPYDASSVYPYSSVVRLVGKSRGSGAVVGRDYVLTAAHMTNAWSVVLYDQNDNGLVSFDIDSGQSYYNPRQNQFGDFALLKMKPGSINGKEVHIGDLRKPLMVVPRIVGQEESGLAYSTGALLGFPEYQGSEKYNHTLFQKAVNVGGVGPDDIVGTFSGGGGGFSGGPLLNSQMQIAAVYHGSSRGYKAYSAKVAIKPLIDNTDIGNESSRIYVWPDINTQSEMRSKIKPNGDYLETKNDALITMSELFNIANNVVKTGYHVISLTNGIMTYNNNSILNMPIGGLDLYPQEIEKNHYSVKYEKNYSDSTGNMDTQPFTYDENQELSKNTFTKTGYNFCGWNTKPDGTGISYEDEQNVENLSTENNGTIILYAQWKPNNYKIIFNANSGQGKMADQSFSYDEKKSLTKNTFQYEGYTFNGWNTKPDGSGTRYLDEQIIENIVSEENINIPFYAQWIANEYTVSFEANGGSGIMENQLFRYNEAQNLKFNQFIRTGYSFVGWSSDSNDNENGINKVEYTNGENVKNLTSLANGNILLHAQWQADQESAVVDYIDDTTNKIICTKNLMGLYGSTDVYKTNTAIESFKNIGYELVSDDYPIDGVVYDQAGVVKHYAVHLKHTSTNALETKSILRTIHYVDTTGVELAKEHVSNIIFIRTMETDNVTKQSIYSEWESLDKNTTFPEVKTPYIIGYTPTEKSVPEVPNITYETADTSLTIVYKANIEQASVQFVDDTTNKILEEKLLSGEYGTSNNYQPINSIKYYESHGYLLSSNNYPKEGITFNTEGKKQEYEIHFKHNMKYDKEVKTITRHIFYVYSNGDEALAKSIETLRFMRNSVYDFVTKDTHYKDWQALDGRIFRSIKFPEIPGYIANKHEIPMVTNVNQQSKDIVVRIIYNKIDNRTKNENKEEKQSAEKVLERSKSTSKGKNTLNSKKDTEMKKQNEEKNKHRNDLPKTGERISYSKIIMGFVLLFVLWYLNKKSKDSSAEK